MKLASLLPLALVASSLFAPLAAHATPISFSAATAAPITITPSSDTIQLYASSGVLSVTGNFVLQAGNVYIGDSEIANQIILFSFLDTIALNGITHNITVSGQDNVTTGSDAFTIFAGNPVSFGNLIFRLDSTSFSGVGATGEDLPFNLSANISQSPEPASFALLGTGLIGFAMIGFYRHRVLA